MKLLAPDPGFRWTLMLYALFTLAALAGCKPRTPAEKVQNAAEDAAHEVKQDVDRAGKHIKEDTGN